MLTRPGPVPQRLVGSVFIATPLTSDNVDLDFASYMASPDVIRIHSDGRWAVDGFTVDENHRLTAIHEADHQAGRAFAFLLLDPTETESLGCLYLNPLHEYLERVGAPVEVREQFPAASAMVTFWVRQDLQGSGLPGAVIADVDRWLGSDWPLDRYAFRILPAEATSLEALRSAGLLESTLTLPGEHRPYLWFTH